MSTTARVLVALLLALPVAVYAGYSLSASDPGPTSPVEPVILTPREADGTGGADDRKHRDQRDGTRPGRGGDDDPDRDGRRDDGNDDSDGVDDDGSDEEVRVVTPTPTDFDDDGLDDDDDREGGDDGDDD